MESLRDLYKVTRWGVIVIVIVIGAGMAVGSAFNVFPGFQRLRLLCDARAYLPLSATLQP